MKKLLSIILVIILLVSTLTITASAASMTPSNFTAQSIEYYEDYADKVFYNCPKIVTNRTLQSDGTLTNKYDYNLITCESTAFVDHTLMMTGAYMTVNNIVQETIYGEYGIVFTKGATNINVYTGPEDYGNEINITKFDRESYEIARGNLLYWNGYKEYSTQIVSRVNDGGPGHEPQNLSYNLSEPGLYMVEMGGTYVPFGAVRTLHFIIYVTDGTEDLNDNAAQTVSALGTTAAVNVNGNAYNCPAYAINGNNYIRVRDVAYMLNGTNKQFNVYYVPGQNVVMMNDYNNPAYKGTGVEMKPVGAGTVTATLSTQEFNKMSGLVTPLAYVVDGSNYVMLRDIGKIMDFGVRYNNGTVYIDTSTGYYA